VISRPVPAPNSLPRPVWLAGVLVCWAGLAVFAAVDAGTLAQTWPAWSWALAAAAVWGLNLLLLVYEIGPPFVMSRPPILAAGFAFFMTVFGSGSYWATIQLYPWYRVGIERAAWFVAVCTAVALGVVAVARRIVGHQRPPTSLRLEWDWPRLGAVTYIVFGLALVGTVVTIRRIGYVPMIAGDPTSARVDFPSIGGAWYRLSMLGGVCALLVAVQATARRATRAHYAVGLASLGMVGLYGPRFFVALPLGVALLLWDRARAPVRLTRVTLLIVLVAPLLALVGYWRERQQSVALLDPLGLLLYGTFGEFRDLGWALDYYGLGDRFIHGGTLGSVVVPLLPAPVWQLMGIDKAAIYAQSSAVFLANTMGVTTGQRIGAYGEFFINFGWIGALVGAALYGALLTYLDHRFGGVEARQVQGIFFAIAIATAVFALIGQLDMFTSTLTGFGYPLAAVALVAARRTRTPDATSA